MKFYRYHDYQSHNGINIDLSEFELLRETKCGYWIIPMCFVDYSNIKTVEKVKRWISKTSSKRFAYPTKKEAAGNLICRKRKQIKHSEYFMNRAKEALSQGLELFKKIDSGVS